MRFYISSRFTSRAVCLLRRTENRMEIYAPHSTSHACTRTNCGTPPRCPQKQKPLVTARRGLSRITISRRRRHDARTGVYMRSRRAKAIFRSNMIIKSNGIRNSSGARVLSTEPLRFSLHPPGACLVVCCDPLTFSPG